MLLSDSSLHSSKYLRLVCAAPQLVIGSALFFCVCGWLIVWHLPNVYQSETRVYATGVDFGFAGEKLYKDDYIAVQVRASLVTVANLEKVAIENELLFDARTNLDKKNALEDLEANVSLISQRRQGGWWDGHDLVISYRDIDADRSLSVLRSFLDVYLNKTLSHAAERRSRSQSFLDEQVEAYGDLLNDAEGELTRFRTENARNEPDTGNSDSNEAVFANPENEDKFNKLNRNYNLFRDKYLDFVKRRERSVILSDEESTPSFLVVEAPRILPDPVEPNRPLLFTLIFIGACALGIAAPIIRDLIGPSDS